ncbi:MAG TPA: hypothetical protein VK686_09840 [Bryobacteraceae bacterium]|nr:hypothetical protein [Bryobacteraceae bacterium]
MSDEDWRDLINALRDSDDGACLAAAAARLHKTATAEDLQRLLDLLKDDDFFVREAAAWPVSELAGPSALRELLLAYQRGIDEGHDNDGFATALIGVVEKDKSTSRQMLRALADDTNPTMRENSLWLLEFCS